MASGSSFDLSLRYAETAPDEKKAAAQGRSPEPAPAADLDAHNIHWVIHQRMAALAAQRRPRWWKRFFRLFKLW